jgi:two-component system phosphate regulon response regulator PhoB
MDEAFVQHGSAATRLDHPARHRATSVLVITDVDSRYRSLKRRWNGLDAQIRRCRSVADGMSEARLEPPCVILVECTGKVMLGLQLCRSFREMPELSPHTMIVIWADGIDDEQRLAFYQAGCDDVHGDANFTEEAMFRIRAAVRRRWAPDARSATLRYADLELDPAGYRAWLHGRVVHLSTGQTRLLRFFIEHPGQVFSRSALAAALWPDKIVDVEAVKTAVVRLRQALLKSGGGSPIRNVKGEGYMLDLENGRPDPPLAAEL